MFHIPYLDRVPLSRLGVFLSMPTTWPDNLTRTLACFSLSLSLSFSFQKSSQKKTEREVVASFLLPPGVKIPYLLKILSDAVRCGLWTGLVVSCGVISHHIDEFNLTSPNLTCRAY
jgi:hypothetical protein